MCNIKEYEETIKAADFVLIGIGEEYIDIKDDIDTLKKCYSMLESVITEKNYFIVSLCDDDLLFEVDGLKPDKRAAPYGKYHGDKAEEIWQEYMRWLSCTLNKKLVVVELGVGLNVPQVIRWPFEKTVMINNKATLIRVNSTLANVIPEIKDTSSWLPTA